MLDHAGSSEMGTKWVQNSRQFRQHRSPGFRVRQNWAEPGYYANQLAGDALRLGRLHDTQRATARPRASIVSAARGRYRNPRVDLAFRCMRSKRDTAAETERVRRLQDREAPRYDKQIAFFERFLFADGRVWVCRQARGNEADRAGRRRRLRNVGVPPAEPVGFTNSADEAESVVLQGRSNLRTLRASPPTT